MKPENVVTVILYITSQLLPKSTDYEKRVNVIENRM